MANEKKFLNSDGLSHFWSKIKTHVQTNINALKALYDSDGDGMIDKAKLALNSNKVNNFSVLRDVKVDEYTNEEIDQKLVSIMRHKGSVQSYTDLNNISSKKRGDVYNVIDTGDNYAWTGTEWDKLGGNIDLTDYYNKSAVNSLLLLKQNKLVAGDNITIDENNKISSTTKVTKQDITLAPGDWTDYPGGQQFKAYIHKHVDTDYTKAKLIQVTFAPADLVSRKAMIEHGVILENVYSNELWFVCSESKPTENMTIRVVVVW